MTHNGPIIIIDDDQDDLDFLKQVFADLGVENEIVEFLNCESAFAYLEQGQSNPFLVLCDVAIGGMNGIEFKTKIDGDPQLRKKSLPFIFLSTAASESSIMDIYGNLHIQGFFIKPSSMTELTRLMGQIIDYWKIAELPIKD